MKLIAPSAHHVNFFGATETPQAVAAYKITGDESVAAYPIGKGIADTQLLVMVNQSLLAEVGEIGEIWVRTAYLANGYIGPAEQTREKFVINPFTNNPMDLCYRTGDLGRYDEVYDVEYVGRSDQQLKIRGFRIEPIEITSIAETVQGVSRALVRKLIDSEGSATLHLYIAGKCVDSTISSEVMAKLRRELPNYMWPSRIHTVEQMPLLANGKVDVQWLDSLGRSHVSKQGVPIEDTVRKITEFDGPSMAMSADEERIAAVWCDVLQVDSIGPNDRFSDLGGDSLGAIRALVRMKRLGIPEKMCRGILQGKSVREIAATNSEHANLNSISNLPASNETTTLQINMSRGVMIFILVTDHWLEGLLNRLPGGLDFLRVWLMPLFNIATPGFAFMFGLSTGYLYFHLYPQRVGQITRSLRFGAALLFIGIAMRAAATLAVEPLASIDVTTIANSFFSALLFYFLAVLSIPAWFAFIKLFRSPEVGAVTLAVTMLVIYEVSSLIWGPSSETGFMQLARLMFVAKFSYFNLAFGAALGILAGILLRQQSSLFSGWALLPWAASSIGIGLAMALEATGGLSVILEAADMRLWRWLTYIGLTLFLLACMGWMARMYSGILTSRTASYMRLLSVIGQCSLPIFVLHGLVLKAKQLLVLTGIPGWLALALPLLIFFAIMTWMIRNLYHLSYGYGRSN
jgi:hypothetical protein